MNLLHPIAEAHDTGPAVQAFVLDQRVSIAQLIPIMMMKEYGICTHFAANSAAKCGNFPDRKRSGKLDIENR